MCIEGGSAGRKIGFVNQDICFGNKLATFRTIDVSGKYLYYFLQSPYLFDFFKTNMTGIIGGISINNLKRFLVALPNINEQNKIVEKVEKLLPRIEEYNDKYEELEKLNNTYKEELKKSILQYAIQGKLVKQDENDEPASILIDNILKEKHEMMKRKEIKKENLSIIYKDDADNQFYEKFDDGTIVNIIDEIPFDIPDSWSWTRLENLVSKQIKRGKSPKYINKSNVYVFAQKCNPKNGSITLENAKYLDETSLSKYDNSDYIQQYDIVINSTGNGTLGRIGVIDDYNIYEKKCVVDSHVTLLRINSLIDFKYIYYFLKANQKYLESRANGSTNQTELSPEIIKRLLISIPNFLEQKNISDKIDSFLNKIEHS